MKNIVLLAPQTAAGVSTIALNLGIGLTHLNNRVILASANARLFEWLNSPGSREDSLLDRNQGLIWQPLSESNILKEIQDKEAEYSLYAAPDRDWLDVFLSRNSALVFCVFDTNNADISAIMGLNQYLHKIRPDKQGIDLIVPNKVKPGEWSGNSQIIFDLAECLGWEAIADPIPHCEALHDLPKEHMSVWELPPQYSNRRNAFQSLVERVLEMA